MLPGHSLSRLPLKSVSLADNYWLGWQRTMSADGLIHQWKMCEDTGRIENLRRCARLETGGYSGKRFNDSDVYKLMEASAYALSIDPSHPVKAKLDEVVQIVSSAQMKDGYLNSYVQLMAPEFRWKNLNGMHEMYCAGHLIEAAVAHYTACDDKSLLNVAVRFADHIMSLFGQEKRLGYPGHQELEIALVRLAEATCKQDYADYAKWLTSARGSKPSPFELELNDPKASDLLPDVKPLYIKNGKYDGAYAQDDVPLAQQNRAVGHAVRAMYFYCGAVDCLGDDEPAMNAVKSIWDGLVSKQMYITGGIGSSHRNEGFTVAYDLPNLEAYAETCAAIGLVFWGWRMFLLTGESEYIDIVEQALYNAVMSGVSADCLLYFYENPLESDGRHTRKPWYDCACCPPNIARLILSIGQYAVASNENEISIAMPFAGSYQSECGTIVIESNYPWDGSYTLRVKSPTGLKRITLRVPCWTTEFKAEVNGKELRHESATSSVHLDQEWKNGDIVAVNTTMAPRWMESHPDVLSNAGRVALQRGPVIYGLEEHDLGTAPHLWSVDTSQTVEAVEDKTHGTVNLIAYGSLDRSTSTVLYNQANPMHGGPKKAMFTPNYAWANRGANKMLVWVRRER